MNKPSFGSLTRIVQGLREQMGDLRPHFSIPLDRENSFALPPFVTSQDYDGGNSLESAWMLGRGEAGQPNADATCLLQNYWLRIDRNPDTQPLYAGGLQGRLDLRLNGDDAVLFCHAKGDSTDYTTRLDFAGAALLIQSGTDATLYNSFQVSLGDADQYLLSLARGEFLFFDVTLEDDNATVAFSRSETTGFVLTDTAAETSVQLKNGGAKTGIHLIADTTIDIATADVAGNACKFHPWTRNGAEATPPLYVLSSGPGDLGGLPCVFQWDPAAGSLGIGTDADCSALQSFHIQMAHGFNVQAGGSTGDLKLDGGSGSFEVSIAADENVTAAWTSGGTLISIGLGTGTNGLFIDFGNSLTVSMESGEPVSFGTGQHAIKFREVDVCDGGTPKKMIVLASETYSP